MTAPYEHRTPANLASEGEPASIAFAQPEQAEFRPVAGPTLPVCELGYRGPDEHGELRIEGTRLRQIEDEEANYFRWLEGR